MSRRRQPNCCGSFQVFLRSTSTSDIRSLCNRDRTTKLHNSSEGDHSTIREYQHLVSLLFSGSSLGSYMRARSTRNLRQGSYSCSHRTHMLNLHEAEMRAGQTYSDSLCELYQSRRAHLQLSLQGILNRLRDSMICERLMNRIAYMCPTRTTLVLCVKAIFQQCVFEGLHAKNFHREGS